MRARRRCQAQPGMADRRGMATEIRLSAAGTARTAQLGGVGHDEARHGRAPPAPDRHCHHVQR